MNGMRLAGAAAALAVMLGGAGAARAAGDIPAQKVDAQLRARLPDAIRSAGVMTSVNNGSFPPYEIVTGATGLDGASADLATALGQLLGITIKHASVSGFSALLAGIQSGRLVE